MPIPIVTMTQELIEEYAAKYPGKNHAHRPYCKACSTTLDDAYNQKHRGHYESWQKRQVLLVHYSYIAIGEQCYKALFKNGHIAYYHFKCLDAKPELKTRIEHVLKQEPKSVLDLPSV